MEKKITGYTTVDISQWHRKEHFEAFQSVAQCTYNQTVQLDITAFLAFAILTGFSRHSW